jgi:hypothetical protein
MFVTVTGSSARERFESLDIEDGHLRYEVDDHANYHLAAP